MHELKMHDMRTTVPFMFSLFNGDGFVRNTRCPRDSRQYAHFLWGEIIELVEGFVDRSEHLCLRS